MDRIQSGRVRAVLTTLITVFLLSSHSIAADLFRPVFETPSDASTAAVVPDRAAESAAQPVPDPTIVRRRSVHVTAGALDALAGEGASTLTFNLFDDVTLTGTVDRATQRGSGSLVVSGDVVGETGSSFTLVRHGGVLIGNIRVPRLGSFQVRYLGGGIHEVREIDESQFPPCGNTGANQINPALIAPARPVAGGCADDGSVIDMLVVYTEQARVGQGGTAAIEALIALAESETNQAYANSQINSTRINVVQTFEVTYTESGSSGADRDRLVDPADGFLDEVHDLRRDVAADVVSMIVNSLDACGRSAFSISAGNVPHPEIAFNVVQASCATGNFTFGHELAHNQGCRHNRERDPSDGGAFLYSHGYREPAGAFRTVMGGSETGVPRIQHFSNPNVLFGGLPTGLPEGDPASADNARTIENTAFNVANFVRSNDCNNNGLCDTDEIASGTVQDCNGNGLPDDCEDDCNSNGFADECDIADGTSQDCTGNAVPDECEADCNNNGSADSCDIASGASADDNVNGVPDECEPPILFVDQNATGLGTGTNWADAFVDLQDALALASASNATVQEIWVARGTYKPQPPGGDIFVSFELAAGVGLYGGFTGTETSRGERDAALNTTTLSGDLNSNDGPDFANTTDNSHSVLTSLSRSNGATTVLDGFVISGGFGPGTLGTPVFSGGGIDIKEGSPTITNCVFTSNHAYTGGAVSVDDGAFPVVSRCRFSGNTATNFGGAIAVNGRSTPTVKNCVFQDNGGTPNGSALAATVVSVVAVSQCSFIDNPAGGSPGAVVVAALGSRIGITGCVLWNTTPTNDAMLAAREALSVVAVDHSAVLGGLAGTLALDDGAILWVAGNIASDPMLAPDRLHLLVGSPCVGRGSRDNDETERDIDGDPRVQNCIADMGADETTFSEDCNANGQPDGCEIFERTVPDLNQSGVPDECESVPTLFVDLANCPAVGTGTSQNPFCEIQTAIDSVSPGVVTGTIITIADGTYTGGGNRDLHFGGRAIALTSTNGPETCILDAEGASRVVRMDVGDLLPITINGLTIRGGTALAGGGIYIDQAMAVVSGCRIEGNSAERGGGLFGENSSIRVEDCVISQNTANSGAPAEGGGLWLGDGSTVVVGCLIDSNTAIDASTGWGDGGGVFLQGSKHRVMDCTISRNTAGGPGDFSVPSRRRGGGLFLFQPTPKPADIKISGCLIRENVARRGGGLLVFRAGATLEHCTIEDNVAQNADAITLGGGVNSTSTNLILSNCIIRRNQSVNGLGGGVYHSNGTFTLTQCEITGNSALTRGGGILSVGSGANSSTALALLGCTIAGNAAGGSSGGVEIQSGFGGLPSFDLVNSIVWGNSGTTGTIEDAQILSNCLGVCPSDVRYNCVEGWTGIWGGAGNIGDDPNFVDLTGPDGIIGTNDDDLHVNTGSPVIDSGDNTGVPSGLLTDLDGNPRFINDPGVLDTGNGSVPIVDMGIFEGGIDCNGNGVPDPEDIANGTSQDCTGNGFPDECELDCDQNGLADSCDLAAGTALDCNGNAVPDACDVAAGTSADCNGNIVPDECDADGDGDGTPDDCDACPTDPNKTDPGICGCLIPDLDSDNDTVLDCFDVCPGFDDRVDFDADTVPNGCDVCAGFDDRLDADGDSVPDGCDACAGFDDRLDADADSVPDACDQCLGFDDRLDCNTTGTPDGCDIRDGLSPDVNLNGVPDECDVPSVVSSGNRYLTWTPEPGVNPVALRVTSPSFVCLEKYADWETDPELASLGIARLVDAPVFRMPAVWGTLHIRDDFILPDQLYTANKLTDLVNRQVTSVEMAIGSGVRGDVDGLNGADFRDISNVVEAFLGTFADGQDNQDTDLRPCLTDGMTDFRDVASAIDAFLGNPDSCMVACP